MVLFIYFVPGVVTHYRNTQVKIDPAKVDDIFRNLNIPGLDLPGGPGAIPGLPPLSIPEPPKIQ